MKILRQETLERDNLYDSLILYEMGGVYIVSWNCFRKGCFMGYGEKKQYAWICNTGRSYKRI